LLAAVTLVAAATVSLLVAEATLQVASRANRAVARLMAAPFEANAPMVPDDRLIYRGNLLRFDHDAAGYQNDERPARADIVTLGDSMTYGLNDRREAWPRLMAALMGRRVYNMALPGYGPVQSLLQLDEAVGLEPQVIVVAPYFGNDLADSFLMARRHRHLMAGLPASLVASADAREQWRRLQEEIISPFRLGVDGSEEHVGQIRRWVSTNVQVYRLARTLKNRLASGSRPDPMLSRDFAVASAAIISSRVESAAPFEGGGWRTILHGRYRLQALDDRDPRIRVGFLVMAAALEQMAERCQRAGKRFLVVLVPTKESVFWPRVVDRDRFAGLDELVANEDRLRAELKTRLAARGIEVLDLRDPLRAAGEQPYFEDLDGHPNVAGNRVIAARVAGRLAGTRP
jgi:lysophospholipase L1-like esterase